ncbi:MAG: cas4 [Clostridiales bacterium]|jgi:CRISPR-associated exonuclease Cas4|nr:cas4 [Clostridiales bacterium]
MIDGKITGTIVNYFYHCKKQCWLFYHRINLEDNSEEVRIGRVLHQLKAGRKEEVAIDNIRIDKITNEYVVEIKKSDADVNAGIQQLYFYLMKLKEKGIIRKGRLECIEKNQIEQKMIYIELNEELENELNLEYAKIIELICSEYTPESILKKGCKKCAYYEYCFI